MMIREVTKKSYRESAKTTKELKRLEATTHKKVATIKPELVKYKFYL